MHDFSEQFHSLQIQTTPWESKFALRSTPSQGRKPENHAEIFYPEEQSGLRISIPRAHS